MLEGCKDLVMDGDLVQTFQNTLGLFTPSLLHVARVSCVPDLASESKSPYSTFGTCKGAWYGDSWSHQMVKWLSRVPRVPPVLIHITSGNCGTKSGLSRWLPFPHIRKTLLVGWTGPSPSTSLSSITLAVLSQFFSILSDLKCHRSIFSSITNHLSNAKPKEAKKEHYRKYVFSNCKTCFFSLFSILTHPPLSVHNFLINFSIWVI
jgi:hypothetical protein